MSPSAGPDRGGPPGPWPLAGACLLLVAAWTAGAGAQRLPLRCWGVRDGLAAPRVQAIHQDARGYLWIGTGEGLSRFDGYGFRNFGLADGLRHPVVNDLLEDETGGLWVATNGGGIARVEDRAVAESGPPLRTFPVGGGRDDWVNAVLGRGEEIWAITDGGLLRSRRTAAGLAPFRRVLARDSEAAAAPYWRGALLDSRGRLWFSVTGALLQLDGEVLRRHPLPAGAASATVSSLVERPDGDLLVVTADAGLHVFRPAAPAAAAWHRLSVALRPQQTLGDVVRDPAGALWIASRYGLIRWQDGQQQTFTEIHGLPDARILSLAQDRDGNLWIGTNAGGLCRLAPRRIVNYTTAEGLPAPEVRRVVETAEGRILALTPYSGAVEIREGEVVPLRGSGQPPWNAVEDRLVQDRSGAWWIGTGAWFEQRGGAVHRTPAGPLPDYGRAVQVSGRMGLPGRGTTVLPGTMREGADGRLWLVMFGRGLYRLGAEGDAFEQVIGESHIGPFLPEASGDLWYSTYVDFRLRRGGRTWVLRQPSPALNGSATALLRDREGRLWVGFARLGLGRVVEQPEGPPRIQRRTMADGLLSDAITALGEDPRGRIWIGTSKGVQILEPDSGRLQRLTMADGLAGDSIRDLHLDGRRRMWVATATGLSRIEFEEPGPAPRPPPVYLSRVRAGGVESRISPFGLQRLEGLRLVEPTNDLLVEFVGLSFAREGELRYQYRLAGADGRWSPPAAERAVHLARLAAGRYRLEVRAVTEEGVVSDPPAAVSLTVVPPLWRRGWFVALVALVLAATVLWLHRQRVGRLLALERVRGQIASDLHDDIGAGLSEIAILSEAARGQERALAQLTLAGLADRARMLRRALADTVWAVDPRHDRADDLVRRMREVAHNLLGGSGIEVDFEAPPEELLERVTLSPDRRRDLLLLFQELMHNTARHAGAARMDIVLALVHGEFRLRVDDDGGGFDLATAREGHGLASMRARATRLGGRLELVTSPGRGCSAALTVPLRG